MTKALALFSVSYGGCRVRVRILPTRCDVEREFREGRRRRDGLAVHAFFTETKRPDAKHVGTIVLPGDRPLFELIPHEVVHAVICRFGDVSNDDDERFATTVGMLTAGIHRRCSALGFGV